MKIELQRVRYMPKELSPGVLYVSEEFGTAAHLCACGCGSKIRTPLGPTDWTFEDTDQGPSLHPSIGNWQQACKSHYWILMGEIFWSDKWTPEQVAVAQRIEKERRHAYYSSFDRSRGGVLRRFCRWVMGIFKQ